MAALTAYFSLAIFVSFLCSLLEAVLLSITPSYISAMKESGRPAGALLEKLKASVDRPLAAILSLNTIAHTVGAAGVGAQAQVVFQNLPLSVISGVLTLLILVFSEIIPKTVGAVYWRSLAVPSAHVLRFIIFSMWPLVVVSRLISRLIARDGETNAVSRDEIHAMADLGHEAGILDQQDAHFLQSVMGFQRVRVSEVFTPRTVVSSLREEATVREAIEQAELPHYSRYPVFAGPDEVKGYVLRKDILLAAARGEYDRKVSEFVKAILIFPEQMTLKQAFRQILNKREHIAAVFDEFGGFSGVVSLEDILETLIGHEIMDEADTVEDMREFARQRLDSGDEG